VFVLLIKNERHIARSGSIHYVTLSKLLKTFFSFIKFKIEQLVSEF